jgi:hypothetical protein
MRSRFKWEVGYEKLIIIVRYQVSTSHYIFNDQGCLTMQVGLCWSAISALYLLV